MTKWYLKVSAQNGLQKHIYTNSQGKYFNKLSLNAASYQTADSTDSVRIPIEPKLKDLKTSFSYSSTKMHWNGTTLENPQKKIFFLSCTFSKSLNLQVIFKCS